MTDKPNTQAAPDSGPGDEEDDEDEGQDVDSERILKLIDGFKKVISDAGPCTCEEVIRSAFYVVCSGAMHLGICRGHLAHQLIDAYDRLEQLTARKVVGSLFDMFTAENDQAHATRKKSGKSSSS